jgi:flagellar basal-body rod protein FlgB
MECAVFESVTMNALSSALDGLAARQQAIAQNIANVNTPNYKAKVVSFENALAQSVASGSGVAGVTETTSTAPTVQNGNNVSLDSETLNNIQTVLQYQFAAQAVNMDFDATSTALKTA